MVKSPLFVPRTYRYQIKDTDLVSFTVLVKETDLYIRASRNLRNKSFRSVEKYRKQLENYIGTYPNFLTSLKPVSVPDNAPRIVKAMAEAAAEVDVGPMAAVAGAIAEFVGQELTVYTPEIIIENGGDIYIKSIKSRVIGIFTGISSPLKDKIGIEIPGGDTPLGICTSSGTVGHSLSLGKADAAVVLAKSATLADAAATAIGNIINTPEDIEKGLAFARRVKDIKGIVIIIGERMGVWGDVKLVV